MGFVTGLPIKSVGHGKSDGIEIGECGPLNAYDTSTIGNVEIPEIGAESSLGVKPEI